MEIKVEADLLNNADAWHREWHEKRNAAVAALVADGKSDGKSKRLWEHKGQLSRDEYNDEQMRWLFWRLTRSETERARSERATSPDAYLYEAVTSCMGRARDDERARIAAAISSGLKALLGDEFESLMYDIAELNDINIGYDG